MNFLCPSCRTPLPSGASAGLVTCGQCSVEVDLTRVDTAPGQARLWPEVDLTGEALSGHQLVRRIGGGGMGTVYEARAPDGATVALKVLAPMLAAEPALRERFRREARALAQVKHPRVVQLLGEGEERGFCWYSMELVRGEDLRQRLTRGALSPDEVRVIAAAVLEALTAVHAAGIVHRDLKPANVLLDASGARLCDFGIARVEGSSTLTESAALLGSLRYMAPEQRWGVADARSDLYALGVVMHEALALGVPGERELPKTTPAPLVRFIALLTHASPTKRPASAAIALATLEARRFSAVPYLAVMASGLVAIGIGYSQLNSETPPEPMPPAPVVVAEVVDAGAPVEVDAGQAIVEAPVVDAGTLLSVFPPGEPPPIKVEQLAVKKPKPVAKVPLKSKKPSKMVVPPG